MFFFQFSPFLPLPSIPKPWGTKNQRRLMTPYKTEKQVITSVHIDTEGLGKGQEQPSVTGGSFFKLIFTMFRFLNQDLNMVKILTAQEYQACKNVNEHNQSTSLSASFSLCIYSLLCEKACLKDISSYPLPQPSDKTGELGHSNSPSSETLSAW